MNHSRRPNLVLLEILIVAVFFALSAVVILKVYTASYSRAERSREMTRALTIAQDELERLAASGRSPDAFFKAQGWTSAGGDIYERTADAAGYLILATVREDARAAGALYGVELSVWRRMPGVDDAHSVVSLQSSFYLPGGEVAG